jgi:hypothetical protein
LQFDGSTVFSRQDDLAANPGGTGAIYYLPSFTVTYGVPFTLTFSASSWASAATTLASDCGTPTAYCEVDSIAEAEAQFQFESITIPYRAKMTSTSGFDYTVAHGVVPPPVPEPSTMLLSMAGLAALMGLRNRQHVHLLKEGASGYSRFRRDGVEEPPVQNNRSPRADAAINAASRLSFVASRLAQTMCQIATCR